MAVSFFAPRFLRHAHRLAKSAEELLHRKRDLLTGEEIATYETAIARFRAAVETRDRMKILKAGEALDGEFEPIAHAPNSLREWAETIVVSIAVVVACSRMSDGAVIGFESGRLGARRLQSVDQDFGGRTG